MLLESTISNPLISSLILLILVTTISCEPKSDVKSVEKIEETIVNKELTLEDQLNEIMSMWPGIYNNDKQIEEVIAQGKDVWRIDDSGEDGYLQIQSHYISIDKSDIGDHVLYVEEYRDHVPTETYRQRIYTLSIDSTDMIKVKMWPFKNKKKYIGAWQNLSLLDDLTRDSISAFPDICDLHVTKKGDEYHMVMNESDCTFGEKVYNYQVKLSKDMFSYRDKITQKSDGEIISTAANFAYHDLNRIE